jgi:hypothetical protein
MKTDLNCQFARNHAVKCLREYRRTRSPHWWREYHSASQWLKQLEAR